MIKRLRKRIDRQEGTLFQKKVWKVILQIPRGEVRTYGWVARKISRPRAVRAVGNALGKNPLAPEVPCHRVVASDGIGGYTGGIRRKMRLLRREGVEIFSRNQNR